MKVTSAERQQMIELQLAQVRTAQTELHYRKTIEDNKRLRKVADEKNQELRTERNKRLGHTKGQNVDIDC